MSHSVNPYANLKFGSYGIMLKIKLAALVLLSFVLSACNSVSTPTSTIHTAYNYLMKNKEKKFYSVLTGNAAIKFANTSGMQVLQNDLSRFPTFKIGEEKIVSRVVLEDTYYRKDIITNYSVLLLAGIEVIHSVDVVCENIGMYVNVVECSPGRYHDHCHKRNIWQEVTDCKISDIK